MAAVNERAARLVGGTNCIITSLCVALLHPEFLHVRLVPRNFTYGSVTVEEIRSPKKPFVDATLDRLAVCFYRVKRVLSDHGVEADDEIMDEAALALLAMAKMIRPNWLPTRR